MAPGASLLMRGVLGLLASVILGSGLTVLLWPLWGWFERASGIEALGHSGPASWCLGLTTLLVFAGWLVGARRLGAGARCAAPRRPNR